MADLIDRQAAIDALNEVSEHYTDKGREWHPHVNFMVEAIENLPSAQPERKKGRWIYYPEINALSCSECKRYVYHYEPYNYCPNCGAEMEVEE